MVKLITKLIRIEALSKRIYLLKKQDTWITFSLKIFKQKLSIKNVKDW